MTPIEERRPSVWNQHSLELYLMIRHAGKDFVEMVSKYIFDDKLPSGSPLAFDYDQLDEILSNGTVHPIFFLRRMEELIPDPRHM